MCDLEVLQLPMANARWSCSDIADVVGLSAPAVSDRVERLQEMGIINRFTLDVIRSQLRAGIPVLITLDIGSTGPDVPSVKEHLLNEGAVERVFTTTEVDDIASWLTDILAEDAVGDFGVTPVSRRKTSSRNRVRIDAKDSVLGTLYSKLPSY